MTGMFGKFVRRSAVPAVIALLCSAAPALADQVYLTCTDNDGPPSFRRYITVDYGAGTVVTSDMNTLTPYGTTQNVQITDSQIVWQVVGEARANGLYYAEHYTLNRLTGDLSYYDDGTQHGEAWTCTPGSKPAPKF